MLWSLSYVSGTLPHRIRVRSACTPCNRDRHAQSIAAARWDPSRSPRADSTCHWWAAGPPRTDRWPATVPRLATWQWCDRDAARSPHVAAAARSPAQRRAERVCRESYEVGSPHQRSRPAADAGRHRHVHPTCDATHCCTPQSAGGIYSVDRRRSHRQRWLRSAHRAAQSERVPSVAHWWRHSRGPPVCVASSWEH